ERAPRHTRALNHMRDTHLSRPVLERGVHHRPEDSRALELSEMLTPQPIAHRPQGSLYASHHEPTPTMGRAGPWAPREKAPRSAPAYARTLVAARPGIPRVGEHDKPKHAPDARERPKGREKSSQALNPASHEPFSRRRGLAPRRQLSQRERERERERRVSDTDASYHTHPTTRQ